MSQAETARAWWADVEHLRDDAERRQTRRAHAPAPRRPAAPARRRTVEITGRTVPAPVVPRAVDTPRDASARRRPPRTPSERVGLRPDRIAMWAPLLGFVLLLVAALSNHG